MKMNWILAVAMMAVLGGGAVFAQDAEKPRHEGDRPAKGEGHAAKRGEIQKRLAEAEAKLSKLKERLASGEAHEAERLAEAIKRMEAKIAEVKAKIAAHRAEKEGEPSNS